MENQYLSSDTTCQAYENEDVQQEWFTPEFLNDIKCSGLPNDERIFYTLFSIIFLVLSVTFYQVFVGFSAKFTFWMLL
ncbi:hypothetical protein Ahy_B03g064549 isoform B [Arachis hypogaea]|nr:hypothetical protein Ahy_B03g064549 isoform B [Arachis hypogaea]